jgi:hypothetical protein|tara:strand:+ start:1738 stop:1920 length:183 start_codon:yes stop_codon:yes gene_type:complete
MNDDNEVNLDHHQTIYELYDSSDDYGNGCDHLDVEDFLFEYEKMVNPIVETQFDFLQLGE